MTHIVKRENFKTEIGKILYDKLIEIYDNDNFILSAFYDIQEDERKKIY